MNTARAREPAEQWITPPEPALERYLLRARPRAANDNRRLFRGGFSTFQIGGACMVLSSALTLIVALVC